MDSGVVLIVWLLWTTVLWVSCTGFCVDRCCHVSCVNNEECHCRVSHPGALCSTLSNFQTVPKWRHRSIRPPADDMVPGSPHPLWGREPWFPRLSGSRCLLSSACQFWVTFSSTIHKLEKPKGKVFPDLTNSLRIKRTFPLDYCPHWYFDLKNCFLATVLMEASFLYYCFSFFGFLGPHSLHMEVPKIGAELEL